MKPEINTYKSDGSDGYPEGTYGVVVSVTDSDGLVMASSDGGWPSRELAEKSGKRIANGAIKHWCSESEVVS